MYIFNPTQGKQVPFRCEETLKKILDWNECPLNPQRSWTRLDTTSTPGFGMKTRENRSLFLSAAYRWSVRGDMKR